MAVGWKWQARARRGAESEPGLSIAGVGCALARDIRHRRCCAQRTDPRPIRDNPPYLERRLAHALLRRSSSPVRGDPDRCRLGRGQPRRAPMLLAAVRTARWNAARWASVAPSRTTADQLKA